MDVQSSVSFILNRYSSSNVWERLPVWFGSCAAGHTDEASAADETWHLPQTQSVCGAVTEYVTKSTVYT